MLAYLSMVEAVAQRGLSNTIDPSLTMSLTSTWSPSHTSAATAAATYGVDVTWTVTTLVASVASNTVSVPVPPASATVLAVETAPGQVVWPPPTLELEVNQWVRITLYNALPSENITLHFHGLLQESGFVSMDGPEDVTQW
jgi:FtsP/CotA-like multicopper oxidase with cupredoxin domain